MKNFKFNIQNKEYLLEINNCIDYKFAGASALFDKYFFKLYCAFWAYYVNWSSHSEGENIRKKIMEKLGLELRHEKITKTNIVNTIKEKIDKGFPVLLSVCSSSLFFSIVYNNNESQYLGHILLITGYDDEKGIIYIRENSINKEVMAMLTKSNPLLQYQLTYQMLEDIIEKNSIYINDYCEKCFYYMVLKENKKLSLICLELYDVLKKCYLKFSDGLVNEIEVIIDEQKYNDKILDEQFHRSYRKSLDAIFDILEENSDNVIKQELLKIKEIYLLQRTKVINVLSRNALKNNAVNNEELMILANLLKDENNKLFTFIHDNCFFTKEEKNQNLLFLKDTIINTDSEKIGENGEIFSANSFLEKQNMDSGNSFWASDEGGFIHWLVVTFAKKCNISRIIIENSKYRDAMTSDYKLFYSNTGNDWIKIADIIDNQDSVNSYIVDLRDVKCIKIEITKPNKAFKKMCIIRNLYIYGKEE